MQFALRIILIISILLFFNRSFSNGQIDSLKTYTREFSLTIDNDIFFLVDRYYTAGHQFSYRKLLSTDKPLVKWFNRKDDLFKVISSFQIGNKIFTPKKTTLINTINMDRPYAGYAYLSYGISRLRKLTSVMRIEFEVGLVGKATGLGQAQQWWHKQVGYDSPTGWDSQISSELLVNMNNQFIRSIKIRKAIDVVSGTTLSVGTVSNKVSQDLTLRLFDFNPITQSLFTNSRLAYEGDGNKRELFIFFGLGLDYVFTNVFLEGSLFESNTSPLTVEALPWLFRESLGIMFARRRNSFALCLINTSREMENGRPHGYGSFVYSLRF